MLDVRRVMQVRVAPRRFPGNGAAFCYILILHKLNNNFYSKIHFKLSKHTVIILLYNFGA